MRLTLAFLLFVGTLFAQQQEVNPAFTAFDKALPTKANRDFQFFAYFYNQGVTANWFPANDFLKGQIVGRLFGANTTVTSDSIRGFYAEQRCCPFLSIHHVFLTIKSP